MPQKVVLYVRFKTKAGKKDEFRQQLYAVIETMKEEPAFVNAIIHDDPNHPDDIVIYETWQGTRESWLKNEFTRPYRASYEKLLAGLLEERDIVFLTPVDEWQQTRKQKGFE
jgi:quinol monooxygenase YgiN